jgi:hypothetical protein
VRYKNAVSGQVSRRFTVVDVRGCFKRLCIKLHKSQDALKYDDRGKAIWKIGAWHLDHEAGGFRVHEIYNKHGAVEIPLGHIRRNAHEFCQLVWAIEALIDSGAVKVSK